MTVARRNRQLTHTDSANGRNISANGEASGVFHTAERANGARPHLPATPSLDFAGGYNPHYSGPDSDTLSSAHGVGSHIDDSHSIVSHVGHGRADIGHYINDLSIDGNATNGHVDINGRDDIGHEALESTRLSMYIDTLDVIDGSSNDRAARSESVEYEYTEEPSFAFQVGASMDHGQPDKILLNSQGLLDVATPLPGVDFGRAANERHDEDKRGGPTALLAPVATASAHSGQTPAPTAPYVNVSLQPLDGGAGLSDETGSAAFLPVLQLVERDPLHADARAAVVDGYVNLACLGDEASLARALETMV